MQEIVKNQIFVKEEESGMRLDKLMSLKFPVIGREEWRERIQTGMVMVNSQTVKPSRIIQKDNCIEFFYTKKEEPEVSFDVKTLYEDDFLLALDKPGNLPVHPSGIYYRNTLHHFLKNTYGEDFHLRPAHRLDRETSGVIILTKTREAAAVLQKSFYNRDVHKEYIVLVEGSFSDYKNAEGILTGDERSAVRKKRRYLDGENTSRFPGAESSRTEFFLIKSHGGLSLLRAVIHTGRMHQIRATLFGLGFPVVGDRLYGVDDTLYIKMVEGNKHPDDFQLLRMERTALHSSRIEFRHPHDGKTVSVHSELPDDFKELLNRTGFPS